MDEATGTIDADALNGSDQSASEPEEAIVRLREAFARMPLAIQVAMQQAVIHQRDVDSIAAVMAIDPADVRASLTSGLRLMHQALIAADER